MQGRGVYCGSEEMEADETRSFLLSCDYKIRLIHFETVLEKTVTNDKFIVKKV